MKNISINKALEGNRVKESRAAILEEIKVMIDYSVGHFQHFHEVPPEERNQILNTFMFIKNKETPDGKFERVKARLVANGKNQHEDLYDLISSSTVNTASVFLLMNIASLHKCSLVSYDIKGAFLHAQFQKPSDKDTYIRIQKEVATIWCEQQPEASQYIQSDGTLILLLDKFIYGLKQAPLKFQQHLQHCLLTAGYTRLNNDPCVYIKRIRSKFSILSIHVDDILQVSNSESLINNLHQTLLNQYKSVAFHPKAHSYQGISINRDKDQRNISLSQAGLIDKIVKENPIPSDLMAATSAFAQTPNQLDLFTYNSDQTNYTTIKQQAKLHKKYSSLIMTLMF
jgi:hypothetical protein